MYDKIIKSIMPKPYKTKFNLEPTHIELFAGVGLVRLGLEQAGWKCVFSNDIDENKSKIFELNFGKNSILVDDIKNVSAAQIPNQITLATASFPCQDLSLAGNRVGLKGARSGTFWHFISLINSLKVGKRHPKMIMIENVPGLITSHGGKDFRAILQALNDLGYLCNAILIDARNFLPQSRARLFIFGIEEKKAEILMAAVDDWSRVFSPHQAWLDENSDIHPSSLIKAIRKNLDMKWFPLPKLNLPANKRTLISIIEPDSSVKKEWWFDEKKIKRMLGQMSRSHRGQLEKAINTNKREAFTGYWRTREGEPRFEVRFDGVAGCLRTPGGGSSKQTVLLVGKNTLKARLLSPREYARLQGVNDNYILPERPTEAYMAMGDAVAVPVITWIAENILNPTLQKIEESRVGDMIAS